MQFLSRSSCNFKSARENQMRFLVRFVAAVSQGFRTCLKLEANLAPQKLHGVSATKIACVNWPQENHDGNGNGNIAEQRFNEQNNG